MPAVLPFIPLIAAGVGGAFGLASASKQANATKNSTNAFLNSDQTKAQTDLINHQKEVGKWSFGQAQSLLPSAKGAIDLPFSHYKAILSGDPGEFNKVLASSNQAIDKSTQASRSTISEFSPHGAVAGQLGKLTTQAGQQKAGTYYDAYNKALAGAGDSATQYGNLFNSLLGTGATAGVPALQSLSQLSAVNASYMTNQQNQSSQALQGLGIGIGQIIAGLLNNQSGGGSRGGSGTKGIFSGGGTEGKP